jgi:hypothetical protein
VKLPDDGGKPAESVQSVKTSGNLPIITVGRDRDLHPVRRYTHLAPDSLPRSSSMTTTTRTKTDTAHMLDEIVRFR